MSGCNHEHMIAHAQVYVLKDEEGEIVARTVHVAVHCSDCGAPLKFEGNYQQPPVGTDAIRAAVGPWASPSFHEIASKLRPFDERDGLLFIDAQGRA